MKGCTWVFVATLLCHQFCLFRVMAAKKERKMKKEPNQYTEPFNATLSNSEELHGHPKLMETRSGKKYLFAEVEQELRRALPVFSLGKEQRGTSVINTWRYLKSCRV